MSNSSIGSTGPVPNRPGRLERMAARDAGSHDATDLSSFVKSNLGAIAAISWRDPASLIRRARGRSDCAESRGFFERGADTFVGGSHTRAHRSGPATGRWCDLSGLRAVA